MKLIYVAGPYRATTPHGILENIRRAESVVIKTWASGHAALCPHLNSSFFDGIVSDKFFLAGTMEMLSRCDGLVLVEGWVHSEGTKLEVKWAQEHNLPIFRSIKDLQNWAPTLFEESATGRQVNHLPKPEVPDDTIVYGTGLQRKVLNMDFAQAEERVLAMMVDEPETSKIDIQADHDCASDCECKR